MTSIDTNVRSDKDGGNALKPIFNEQEIKAGFEIVGALSRETGTFLANRVKEADAKAAQAKEQDRQADEKMTQAQILPDGQEKIRLIQDAAILKNQAAISRIEAADIESKWGAGGDYRQVMTAITAAAGGNISADGGQFVQSIMLNLVQSKAAEGIKTLADDLGMAEGSPAHAALHTLSACAGAAAQGSSCGAAAFGAATASVVSSLLEDSAEVLTSEQKEARKNLIATLVTGVAAANGQAAAANTAALIEMENNSNAKNAVKAAINDAKDYVGKKGKEGLEKAVELLEKIEIKPLVEKQKEIGKFLDEAAARGGLTEGEIAVLGIIYAANEALFPTSALDLIPGAGKAVGKTGMLVKAGMKAEDAAKIAIAEANAAAQAGNYGKVGGHDVHAQAGANGGAAATTVITPAMETKILYGERVVNASGTPTNRLIGAHGGEIANSNPNYVVEVLSVNVDGTRNAKLLTQFSDGNVSNIKTSTLFPENWTPSQSIGAVKQVGDLVPVATRADGAALYQSTVNGVQIKVIKIGNNVTAGYPVGSRGFQTKTYFLTGKN